VVDLVDECGMITQQACVWGEGHRLSTEQPTTPSPCCVIRYDT